MTVGKMLGEDELNAVAAVPGVATGGGVEIGVVSVGVGGRGVDTAGALAGAAGLQAAIKISNANGIWRWRPTARLAIVIRNTVWTQSVTERIDLTGFLITAAHAQPGCEHALAAPVVGPTTPSFAARSNDDLPT